jgi:hypothetical protein
VETFVAFLGSTEGRVQQNEQDAFVFWSLGQMILIA